MDSTKIFQDAAAIIDPNQPNWFDKAEIIITQLFDGEISAGRLRVLHLLLISLKEKHGDIYKTQNMEEKLFGILQKIIKSEFKKSFQTRAREVITQILQLAVNQLI